MSARLIDVSPGNGTRYRIVISELEPADLASFGAGPDQVLVTLWPHDGRNSAACFVTVGGYFAPYYIGEKLRLGDADAQAVSDILHRELSPVLMAVPDMHETTEGPS